MESNFFSQIIPFLVFVILIVIHLPTSLCVVNEQYERCGRVVKCGNITITYPFYTLERPSYCGYGNGRFNLYCQDGILTTDTWFLDEIIYRVLAIDVSTQTVTLARNDYWDSYCPTVYRNTTQIAERIWMYYGCPTNITDYANRQFTCIGNITGYTTIGYYITDYDFYLSDVEACDLFVSIPASKSAVITLHKSPSQENLMAAIHGGFELIWEADNHLCSACVKSGGQCGSNAISDESEFICYCPDRPYPATCVTGSSSTTNLTGSSSTTNITRSSSGLNIRLKFAIGVSAAVVGSIIIVFVLCFLRREGILYKLMIFRMKNTKNDQNVDAFIRNNGSLLALKQYKYSDVKKITKSFTDKLGQGGYGCVYKGKLSDGRLVAIKVLNEYI